MRVFAKKIAEMFAIPKLFVSLHPQTLGYGVMVTLQILVLSFLVRIQVAQQTTSFLMTKTR